MRTYVFLSVGYISKNGNAELSFNLKRYCWLFSKVIVSFWIPSSNVWEQNLLLSFLILVISKWVCRSFNLRLPNDWWCWGLFPVLILPSVYYFLGKCLFRVCFFFFNLVVYLFVMELNGLFIYTDYKSFIRYVLITYFLPVCNLPSHFHSSVFWGEKNPKL